MNLNYLFKNDRNKYFKNSFVRRKHFQKMKKHQIFYISILLFILSVLIKQSESCKYQPVCKDQWWCKNTILEEGESCRNGVCDDSRKLYCDTFVSICK